MYKKASNTQLEWHFTNEEKKIYCIAFGKVVSFTEEVLMNSTYTTPILKLSDLMKLYNTSFHELGTTFVTRIHSTRFEQRLLAHIDDMTVY